MVELKVVSEHHQVLRPWSQLRCSLERAPAVLTLDHHTDVLPAFGRYAQGDETLRQELIANFDYTSEESIADALSKLRHDEHIDLALRAGVISSALIIAHENFTTPAHEAMRVYVEPNWPDGDTMLNDPVTFRPFADKMLEDEFLLGAKFCAEEWILDIDLDSLLTAKAVAPTKGDYFDKLWQESRLVTISKEEEWIRLLRLPNENIDADFLLSELKKRFNYGKSDT